MLSVFSAPSLTCLTFSGKLFLFVVWPGCYRRTFLQERNILKERIHRESIFLKQDSERNYLVHMVCIDQIFQLHEELMGHHFPQNRKNNKAEQVPTPPSASECSNLTAQFPENTISINPAVPASPGLLRRMWVGGPPLEGCLLPPSEKAFPMPWEELKRGSIGKGALWEESEVPQSSSCPCRGPTRRPHFPGLTSMLCKDVLTKFERKRVRKRIKT